VGRHTDDIEVVRNDALTVDDVRAMAPDGILISPGPGRPADAGITEPLIEQLGPATPVLGVCLGHQAIGEVYGGTITHAPSLMHGKTSTVRHDNRSVFEGVEQDFEATRYHSLIVDRDGFPEDELAISAETDDGVIMGLRHRRYPIEGIQFHPESVMTAAGPHLIENWLKRIAKGEVRVAK
jgi:anthranilate synthase/aminodeoxychorismate synthase-like glutamine amidotransferase